MFYQFFIQANDSDSKNSFAGMILLFAIGFVPLFLGVEVKNLSIDISWFGQIVVANAQNVSILYMMASLITFLRFYLRNKDNYNYLKISCLRTFLKSKYGDRFIKNNILAEGFHYWIGQVEDLEDNFKFSIFIPTSIVDESSQKEVFNCFINKYGVLLFQFVYSESSGNMELNYFRKPQIFGVRIPNVFENKSWPDRTIPSPVSSSLTAIKMDIGMLYVLPKEVFNDLRVLDFILPLAANLALLYYFLVKLLF